MGTNTGIGIGIGIPFRNNALGGDNIYFPPELKARMIGVWDNYGKKNTDADRNIIKNKIPNAGGDLEILNAAYEGMSGCNGYPVVFGANKTWENLSSVYSYTSDVTSTTIHITRVKNAGTGLLFSYVKKDGALTNIREIPAFRVTVKGLEGNSKFGYRYLATEDATVETLVYLGNGTHELSKSFAPTEALLDLTRNAWVGIFITPMVEGEVVFDCDITIEVLPEYEGAFVTDGVNDMIISQKTIAEMGITNEVTIVSMIHQITLNSTYNLATTNYIENSTTKEHVRTDVYAAGKTGIYGYTASLINSTRSTIGYILGDIRDYQAVGTTNKQTILDSKFSVVGRVGGFTELSSVAYYWTFAVLGKATEDEINLIIAKYNLDRTLRPDILCNIAKQGITNDNHADFNDKLIDYSGNGRDIQMYNLAWKGGSGVAAKQYETFKDWTSESSSTSIIKQIDEFTRIVESTTNGYWVSRIKRDYDLDKVYDPINVYLYQDNNFLVHECKYEVDGVKYAIPINEPVGKGYHKLEMYTKDRYTELPENAENVVLSEWYFPKSTKGSIKYSIIPSCKGGILLDGINDFGKVTGMPIYKDYTVIADYERFYLEPITGGRASILSKSSKVGDGSFIFNLEDQDGGKACYTFGEANGNISDDITRIIRYQSKYYNTKTLSIGTAEDNDFMVLGKVREVDSRHFCGAIYSLMSFPYSMSKFLIERQLKKHKLGTLYPDMVEFRPVINSNVLLDSKPTFVIRGISTNLNAGDYVPENSQIWVSIKMNNIADRITKFTVNGKTIDIPENAYSEVTLQYGFPFVIDKSPQKIGITIEQDENYVLFNPVITSNVEYHRLDFYLNNYQKIINIGDYIPKDAYLRANIYLNNNVDELTAFIFNGVNIGYRRSSVDDTAFNISHIYNYDSPQEVNITIDEYIRYEDIVQPYPVLLRFNDENGNEVSWGGKFRVGSTITRIGSAADSNLLPNIYNIFGLLLNDNQVTSSKVIVEKTMVFKAKSAYIFDNNEPNCILSPRLLRIPNSSYKILGYIPDISGHGNHGVIHNSAYAKGSGVNEDGSYQFDGVNDHVTIPTVTGGGKQVLMKVNNNTINSILYDQRSSGASPNSLYSDFAIYSTNTVDNNLIAYQSRLVGKTYIDGILNTNITCEDLLGVLHNITITCDIVAPNNGVVPNIGRGGVLKDLYSKVALYDFMLFDDISTDDKIKELNEYVGIEAKVEKMPYYWDAYGKTNLDVDRGIVPQLGIAKDYSFASFDNEMAWYLIPNDNYINVVSRNGYEITLKNLSTGVNGWRFQNSTVKRFISHDIPFRIKANKSIRVYWDMHSYKVSTGAEFGEVISITNVSPNKDTYINLRHLTEEELAKLDTNKDRMYYLLWFDLSTIAVNEEVVIEMLPVEGGRNLWLNNYNFAYDKMSGFGGYNLSRFDKSWSSSSNTSIKVVQRNPYDITLKKLGGNSDWEFNNTELKVISNPVSVKFKSNKNIRVTCDYHYYPVGGNSEGTPLGITSKDLIANKDAIITISPISQENIDKYNIDVNRGYYLIYFQLSSTLVVNEEVTIEMLPLYPNGLVYDGVTDYSENTNIPAFTDFTYILKRQILKGIANSAVMYKGNITVNQGGAFICNYCEPSDTNLFTDFSFGGLLRSNDIDKPIIYGTKTSVNGDSITPGENIDTVGINVGKWVNYLPMVLYKLILYPKTIPLLQINFLKNLMERDEIIDLDNPIFKK